MPSPQQFQGNRGEMIAKSYLEREGFRFLEHQWRCRYGEIDLIMKERDELVFVEVKWRTNNDYGNPEEMVTRSKARKLTKTAFNYLRTKTKEDVFWRFDTIAITGNAIDHEIMHFRDSIRND
jgi:putative endonuclease